ncbi:hypothetical protein NXF25_005433 [Crotalus adamanteus]|uniref:Uncharacterized protein n=1 Tax=Crotalus adamanteus TaxID=8729 RepID=A0AAW1BWX1_CROAD
MIQCVEPMARLILTNVNCVPKSCECFHLSSI